MHLDVVPSLRCPRPHEEAALVLAADATQGRHVITGILGCPVCEAEYPIRAGVAYFAEPSQVTGAPVPVDAFRMAAMLNLTEPGGVIMLGGRWSIDEIPDALVLVVNPLAPATDGLYAGERLPIAARALRAAAITDPMPGVVEALRPKGRLVATNAVPVPPEITELARDSEFWVGERGPALSALQRPVRPAPPRT